MKYFKQELWQEMNTGDITLMEKAEEEWNKNSKQYWDQYKMLENKLPKEIFELFKQKDFHDFRLKEYKIIHHTYGEGTPVNLHLILTNDEETWLLEYSSIKKMKIDFETEELQGDYQRGFDDFGYQEFLEVDENIISHEILFASGAQVLIHFQRNSIRISQI
ncbi:hypothetical protein [Paenibacillus chitinolyticus]|uniref:hypothetical protein n=1 Tax=Paenibacillus chitinolyticus TaxID=79263 RepID=UPI0036708A4E